MNEGRHANRGTRGEHHDHARGHPSVASTIALIHKAFEGVVRGDGTSWLEADLLDNLERDQKKLAQARAADTRLRWQDLVDDETWAQGDMLENLNFVDPEGFRFYIAPAMIRSLQGRADIYFHLTRPQKCSMLSGPQRACVAQWLRCEMSFHEDGYLLTELRKGYEQFWREHDPQPLGPP